MTGMPSTFHRKLPAVLVLVMALGLGASTVRAADVPSGPTPQPNWFVGDGRTEAVPNEVKNVTVKEHLNSTIPLDLAFTDEYGKSVKLREYFSGKKPVLLQLGYYKCPMLCSLISEGIADTLSEVKLDVGKDFEVVFVSIDPSEGSDLAEAKKHSFERAYHRPGTDGGWHLLTGKQDQIKKLADAVGFEYRWVESAGQFSHPACIVLATPDGHISRYLYGVKFDPKTVRLSLVEASDGKIGTTVDAFILTCFQFDGHQGKYALMAVGMMRIGGAVTVLAVASLIGYLLWRERRRGINGVPTA
jgi:protein SCO1/2